MNIIKHILSKQQNSEHFISIIIYSTMEIMKSAINLKLSVPSVLTIGEGAGHFDTLVKPTRICISQGCLE